MSWFGRKKEQCAGCRAKDSEIAHLRALVNSCIEKIGMIPVDLEAVDTPAPGERPVMDGTPKDEPQEGRLVYGEA